MVVSRLAGLNNFYFLFLIFYLCNWFAGQSDDDVARVLVYRECASLCARHRTFQHRSLVNADILYSKRFLVHAERFGIRRRGTDEFLEYRGRAFRTVAKLEKRNLD